MREKNNNFKVYTSGKATISSFTAYPLFDQLGTSIIGQCVCHGHVPTRLKCLYNTFHGVTDQTQPF